MQARHDGAKPIRPLDEADKAQLTSSVVITSLRDVIYGLVQNSLDASASRIEIRFNLEHSGCVVEDDGCGFAAIDFAAEGGLFKRHWTSKHNCINAHGTSGAFLASVAAMSLITVITSQGESDTVSSMTIHYSKVVLCEPVLPRDKCQHLGLRTQVTVRNLFGNLPVRLKKHALEQNPTDFSSQWQQIKHDVVSLLLAWPSAVSVLLEEESNASKLLLRASPIPQNTQSSSASKLVRVQHQISILTQAKYIQPKLHETWVATAASNSTLSIHGAISLVPAASKQCQFLALSIRPCLNHGNGNELYGVVNKVFADSCFGTIEDAILDEEELLRRSRDKRFKPDGLTGRALKGGRKGIERWPMFFLQIKFKKAVDQDKAMKHNLRLDSVINLLGAMVTQWLVTHQFRPPKWRSVNLRTNEQQHKPILPACLSKTSEQAGTLSVQNMSSPAQNKNNDTSSREPTPETLTLDQKTGDSTQKADIVLNGCIEWDHPITHIRYFIDTQTGATIAKEIAQNSELHNKTSTSVSADRKTITKSVRLEENNGRDIVSNRNNEWIHDMLNRWENPIFANSELVFPHACLDSLQSSLCSSSSRSHKALDSATGDSKIAQGISTIKLSAADLYNSLVISQLEGKFVFLSIMKHLTGDRFDLRSAKKTQQLVIVDQHAADERIKVERLFQSLCSGSTSITLEEPLYLHIPSEDAKLLKDYSPFFLSWSISYSIDDCRTIVVTDENENDLVGLSVTALPAEIMDRCLAEPYLLIETLRREIRTQTSTTSRGALRLTSHDDQTTTEHQWLKTIADCPAGIIDMLNSYACRSAVMFNDKLTIDECKVMIKELANCAFPFQCAHGRPSAVPLIELDYDGSVQTLTSDDYWFGDFESPTFASAFRQWHKIEMT